MILTEQHNQLRDSIVRFIDDEINPHIDDWEAEGCFPAHEVFKKAGDMGFLGVSRPEEFGGMGLDWSYTAVASEAWGNIRCGGVPMAIGVHTDMATPALARFGSDELRREYLVPSIAGDLVACLGVSEVGAGSDVASTKTTARRDGSDYVINGGKMWTTNGSQADWMCCLVNTGDGGEAAHKSKSLIVIPMNTPGVTVARTLDKLGMRSSDTAQIHFDDVRVPATNLVGQEGQGFFYQMLQFQEERLWSCFNGLAPMEWIIQQTIEYTRGREVFGKPVLDNQVVHFRLAELQTEVESLRAMSWQAVELMLSGEDVTRLASMAKLKGGRLAREVNDACLQYWGGMGYMSGTPVSRAYRDGRLWSIGAGADEIMLNIICKYMGTLPGQN